MSPIRNDLSGLPTAESTEGEPPDANPRFIQLLVEQMRADELAENPGGKPTAFGTRIRHSDAGKCARALGYTAIGLKGEPMDLPGVWVTSLGRMLHERWQKVLLERDSLNVEVEVKLRIDGLDASGSSDARIEYDPSDTDGVRHRICYELKTTGGFGYKMKVGERGAPQGPDYSHKLQGALNAVADDADELIIGYLATEAISKPAAQRKHIGELTRFAAEWSYPREVFTPWAAVEQARMQGILDVLDSGFLPRRVIPSPELPVGHEIVDPSTGAWAVIKRETRPNSVGVVQEMDMIQDTGTFWACGYCAHQKVCSTTKPGRIPITDVKPLHQGIGDED